MSRSETQDQWLDTILDQLRALDGVACEDAPDGIIKLGISRNGESRDISIDVRDSDYRALKIRYGAFRDVLTGLGIEEGMTASTLHTRQQRKRATKEHVQQPAR